MRLLHATTFLQGGAGRIIAALALAQKSRGHDVRIVTDDGGEPGYENYPEYLEALAKAAVPLAPVHSTFKRDLALQASAARALRAALGDWQPDIVHAHAAVPAVVARLAGIAGVAGAPVVHTMHGWGVTKTAAQAAADLAVLDLADAIATPAHAARQALVDLGLSAPVHVIPYGIEDRSEDRSPDAEDIALLRRIGNPHERALCIGTIGERKNQRLVLQALARPELKRATAIFIGDGDQQPLLAAARSLGVADRIAILGYRPRASRYLACARVLVLPSRNEGLPLAVLEAFRAGVPVVASRIPELAEALEHGRAGYLFEPESVDGLARALRAAFDRHDERSAGSVRAIFAAQYTLDRMVRAYHHLYQQCRPGRGAVGICAGRG